MDQGSFHYIEGDLVSQHGNIKVYSMNNELFMEQDKQLIYSDLELSDYIWQISSKPFGNCLVLGLGLGVATKYILSLNKVKKLTVVEESLDIINSQVDYGIIYDERLTAVRENYITYLYTTKQKFDFIFLDCYSRITNETLPMIADLVAAAKRCVSNKGVLIGWMDMSTPEKLVNPFYGLFFS